MLHACSCNIFSRKSWFAAQQTQEASKPTCLVTGINRDESSGGAKGECSCLTIANPCSTEVLGQRHGLGCLGTWGVATPQQKPRLNGLNSTRRRPNCSWLGILGAVVSTSGRSTGSIHPAIESFPAKPGIRRGGEKEAGRNSLGAKSKLRPMRSGSETSGQ